MWAPGTSARWRAAPLPEVQHEAPRPGDPASSALPRLARHHRYPARARRRSAGDRPAHLAPLRSAAHRQHLLPRRSRRPAGWHRSAGDSLKLAIRTDSRVAPSGAPDLRFWSQKAAEVDFLNVQWRHRAFEQDRSATATKARRLRANFATKGGRPRSEIRFGPPVCPWTTGTGSGPGGRRFKSCLPDHLSRRKYLRIPERESRSARALAILDPRLDLVGKRGV